MEFLVLPLGDFGLSTCPLMLMFSTGDMCHSFTMSASWNTVVSQTNTDRLSQRSKFVLIVAKQYAQANPGPSEVLLALFRSGQIWGHKPEQRVAAATLRRYSFGLCLAIAQTDARHQFHENQKVNQFEWDSLLSLQKYLE